MSMVESDNLQGSLRNKQEARLGANSARFNPDDIDPSIASCSS